ncbi:MAG: hypothetical protein OEZ39_08160 [Gammaproteobacteria bacterium]|nr:hypothetical protein [Gammaproteobacteria bacterium]
MLKEVFKLPENWLFHDEVESEGLTVWLNDFGDQLIVKYFPIPPDIDAPLHDLGKLRDRYRQLVTDSGGALIEADTIYLQDILTVKIISKSRMQPAGFIYVGSFTLPFAECSYVIRIMCSETGMTGVREAIVTSMLINNSFDEDAGNIKDWETDPYDPNIKADFMSNKADAVEYDVLFPDHPLSRLRNALNEIEKEIVINKSLYMQDKYIYKIASNKSKWWEFWK